MASSDVAPGREARAAVTGAEQDSLLLPWTFNLTLLIATGQPPRQCHEAGSVCRFERYRLVHEAGAWQEQSPRRILNVTSFGGTHALGLRSSKEGFPVYSLTSDQRLAGTPAAGMVLLCWEMSVFLQIPTSVAEPTDAPVERFILTGSFSLGPLHFPASQLLPDLSWSFSLGLLPVSSLLPWDPTSFQ